jgi:hypothetical protein
MRISKTTPNYLLTLAAAAAAVIGSVPAPAAAQDRQVPDTYKAVTVNMSPADVELKADVLRWSSDEDRAAVVAALGQEDPAAALRELPTHGVVWRSGSAVGHSIKYAHRTESPDGSETLTFVTDKAVGATSFSPWVADTPATDAADLGYSVIEMTTNGDGTMSLAAPVVIDEAANIVSLDTGAAAAILTSVRKEPPPYWARTGD